MCATSKCLRLDRAVERIEAHEVAADSAAFIALLRQCSKEKDLVIGKRVHSQIVLHRLDHDRFLSNLLVQMYGKCGSIQDARMVFDRMPERNAFSWSIMVSAYAQNGHPHQALDLYHEMQRRLIRVDGVTYVSVLSACSSTANLREGKLVHEHLTSRRMALDIYLGAALMNMYGKCGCLEDAWSIFQQISAKDVVVWNAMIAAYAQNGQSQQALELYEAMKKEGVEPTDITLVSVLDACSDMIDLEEGRRIHKFISMSSKIRLGGSVGNALLNLYGKCGRSEEAEAVFDVLQPKTVVSWTSMISVYVQNGEYYRAIVIFNQMDIRPNNVTFVNVLQACGMLGCLREGKRIHSMIVSCGYKSDVSVCNTLVDMYGKCLDVQQAKMVFDGINPKNVVSWNAMVTAYYQNRCYDEALRLVHRLDLEGAEFNNVTFVGVLGACAGKADLATGRKLHQRILHTGFDSDVIVATALLTMYGKCQRLSEARAVFEGLRYKNSVTWNAIMNAYIENGNCRGALELLNRMLADNEVKPDGLTFLSALEACSLLGDVEAGRSTHEKLVAEGFESETVVMNSLITMYGKCGCLCEARSVLDNMNSKDVVSWNAMLAAYVQSGHYKDVMKLYRDMLLNGYKPEEATFLPVLEACASSLGSASGKIIHNHITQAGWRTNVLDSALVNMYGKCGRLDVALALFEEMKLKDSITWTSMIASYAQHGHGQEALAFFHRMQLEGVCSDGVTLGCVVFACGHSGNVKLGREYFVSMLEDYSAWPTFEHYLVMSDMLSRAGRLAEAEDLLRSMPYQPDLVSWRSLLSACSNQSNVEIGKRAGDVIFELNPGDSAAFVLLSNIYFSAGLGDEVEKLKKIAGIGDNQIKIKERIRKQSVELM